GAHGGRVSRPLSRSHPAQQDGTRGRGSDAVTDVLDITDVHDGGTLSQLAPEWWELWRRAPTATPFQSPAWLLAWWQAFAPGQLFTIAVRNSRGLAALAPFYL